MKKPLNCCWCGGSGWLYNDLKIKTKKECNHCNGTGERKIPEIVLPKSDSFLRHPFLWMMAGFGILLLIAVLCD